MVIVLFILGCQTAPVSPPQVAGPVNCCIPRELRKSVLPPYVIEPPDVLLIDAIHAVPKQPYRIQPFDTLIIQVTGTPAEAPIAGIFTIGADGSATFGPHYQSVLLAGKTVDEARLFLVKYLSTLLVNPEVSVSLVDTPPGSGSPDRTWWPWTGPSL